MRSEYPTGTIPVLGESEAEQTSHYNTESRELSSPPEDAEGRPYLVGITGLATGRVYFFDSGPELLFGRGSQCNISLLEQGVSRAHARVYAAYPEVYVEDLGSANGTYLNGRRITGRYALQTSDRIRIGSSTFRFEDGQSELTPVSGSSTGLRLGRGVWERDSWRRFPALHQATYYNNEQLAGIVARLRGLPPLVTSWEVESLKQQIADAQRGERFILQGGDCAETFAECTSPALTNKLKILYQMSLVLTYAARRPVTRIGRFAGQYAKPRSKPTERRGEVELPSYLGDLVNSPDFTADARRHDPNRLLDGYFHAALTQNFIRSMSRGGLAVLEAPEYLDLSFFEKIPLSTELHEDYRKIARVVAEGLEMMRSLSDTSLANFEFFSSHEGLHLEYESAQTRNVPRREDAYCLTTHLPWIGERTRALDGAHVEFFRGVANPVGVKVGPSASPRDVVDLIRVLNPDDSPGKLVLIVRMGSAHVQTKLPPIIEAVTRSRRRVLWMVDPMHGNGITTQTGIKTRNFDDILREIEISFDIHAHFGTVLGGIHFELTGDDVTECIGGGTSEADLDTRYQTLCDPRLNYRQAIQMAFCVARQMRARKS